MKSIIFGLGIFLLLPQYSFALSLYVAPDGKDTNPGTKAKPFKTLTAARDTIRKVNKAMSKDIIVYIRGGLYNIDKTLEFGPQDSGFNGHKIIYRAYGGEKPIFSGGIEIKNWTLYSKEKKIYRSKVPKGIYRQLYVNGKRAIRARTPNKISDESFGPYLRLTPDQTALRVSKEDGSIIANVNNIKEIELVVVSHWFHHRLKLDGLDFIDNYYFFKITDRDQRLVKPTSFYKDSTFFYENSFHFIDSPNEWFFDSANGEIYISASSTEYIEEANVVIPRLEFIISLIGGPNNKVKNIEFEGIVFEHTSWSASFEKGMVFDQFAQSRASRLPAAVHAVHTDRFAFRHNVIRNVGGNALFLHNSDYADIEGNEIHQVSANGIVIDRETRNPSPEQQSVKVSIWNNEIKQVGLDYSNGGAIFTNNVRNIAIEHNHIYNLPYSGIQVCNQPKGLNNIGCGGNRICFNHIHHVMQLHDDGGGIYTLGGIQTGTLIAGNFLHDIERGSWAGLNPVSMIYLDNHTSQITVRDNVILGGKAEQRNGSKGNFFVRNVQSNSYIENNAGIKKGYNPRLSKCELTVSGDKLKFDANR